MFIVFSVDKSIQAAAFIAKRHGDSATSIRILKILYFADRELLKETRQPLTGDHPKAMPQGPVLNDIYDLMLGTHVDAAKWTAHFATRGRYVHQLIKDPGNGLLSKLEMAKLDKLCNEFALIDDIQLSDRSHDLPEWKKYSPKWGERYPWITKDDLLDALGMSDLRAELDAEQRGYSELDALLGSVR